jgi:hypothetical protein
LHNDLDETRLLSTYLNKSRNEEFLWQKKQTNKTEKLSGFVSQHDTARFLLLCSHFFFLFKLLLFYSAVSSVKYLFLGTFSSSLMLYCLTQSILMTTTRRKRSTLSSSLMAAVGWTRVFYSFKLVRWLGNKKRTKRREREGWLGKFHQSTDQQQREYTHKTKDKKKKVKINKSTNK